MESMSKVRVFHAGSMGEADVVVAWLNEQGIPAYVQDRLSAGTLEVSQIVAPVGIEVCVFDSALADTARKLLSEHLAQRQTYQAEAAGRGSIDATCEECGAKSAFPVSQAGTVQTCPHCREYLDVPNKARAAVEGGTGQ